MVYHFCVQIDLNNLPDDMELLHQLVRTLVAQHEKLTAQNEQLQIEVARLTRLNHGASSERWIHGQQALFDDLVGKTEIVAPVTPPPSNSESKRNGRQQLPDHLPKEIVAHDMTEEDKCCPKCAAQMTHIGSVTSKQLEYRPAQFWILQHERAKYACRKCELAVVTAEMPPQPIDKGLPGPGLLAHVLTSKYCDHLPLNRQSKIYRRSGVKLHRSTLCGWVRATADELKPLIAHMRHQVLKSKVIHTDETRIPVQERGKKKTKSGRLWPYIGDADHPHVVFDYTETKEAHCPEDFLGEYKGYLHVDAASSFDRLFESGGMTELASWAHARRKFHDAQEHHPERVDQALTYIGALYQIERDAKGMAAVDRQQVRQTRAGPIIDQFDKWLDEVALETLPKSTLRTATNYVRNQWEALRGYLDGGDLQIDNNVAERALRRVAVGRKNYLFAGSDEGGVRAAIHYSIIASCDLHDVDPFEYYRDVLARIPTHPQKDIAELTPAGWAAAREEAVAAQQ